jgi:hypothetical protein
MPNSYQLRYCSQSFMSRWNYRKENILQEHSQVPVTDSSTGKTQYSYTKTFIIRLPTVSPDAILPEFLSSLNCIMDLIHHT